MQCTSQRFAPGRGHRKNPRYFGTISPMWLSRGLFWYPLPDRRNVRSLMWMCFVDYNECEAKRDLCDKNARCSNIAGSYSCFCLPGYFGNGFTCQSECDRMTRCLLFENVSLLFQTWLSDVAWAEANALLFVFTGKILITGCNICCVISSLQFCTVNSNITNSKNMRKFCNTKFTWCFHKKQTCIMACYGHCLSLSTMLFRIVTTEHCLTLLITMNNVAGKILFLREGGSVTTSHAAVVYQDIALLMST